MSNPFGKPAPTAYALDWRKVASALVKALDLHEGYWKVGLNFTLAAGQTQFSGGLSPAAFLSVMGVTLVKAKEMDDLTVDAAFVNPLLEKATDRHIRTFTKGPATVN